MPDRFPRRVADALVEGGWSQAGPDEQQVLEAVEYVESHAGQDGARLRRSAAALRVLREFDGLCVIQDGVGDDLRLRPFLINPTQVAATAETLADLGSRLGTRLFPIGMEGDHEAVLAVAESGDVYSLDHAGAWHLGRTIDQAFVTLVTGREPRRVTSYGPGVALPDPGEPPRATTVAAGAPAAPVRLGPRQSAERLYDRAKAAEEDGRLDDAVASYHHAVELYRRSGDHEGAGLAHLMLGPLLRRLGRLEESVAAFEATRDIWRALGRTHGEALASSALAEALAALDRIDEAVEAWRRGAELYRQEGDGLAQARDEYQCGAALMRARRPGEAVDPLDRSRRLYRDLGERQNEARSGHHLGLAQLQDSRYDQGEATLTMAVSLYRESGDRRQEAETSYDLGIARFLAGRRQEACEAWRQAWRCYTAVDDRDGAARSLEMLKQHHC